MSSLTRRMRTGLAPIDRMRDEFERTMQQLWSGDSDFKDLFSGGEWLPRVDVLESDEALEVKVDLPGIKPEDVDISITEDRLTVKGEREEEKETNDKTYHRVERNYGSFYRAIPLPPGADRDKVSAASENGVLTVTVPKIAAAKAKTIKVKPK